MTPVPTSRPSKLVAAPRKLNYACESCRARKRRCDGGRPRCTACTKHDTECVYKVAASRKYLEDLEAQCARLQSTLAQLKVSSEEERGKILETVDESWSQQQINNVSSSPTQSQVDPMSNDVPRPPERERENLKILKEVENRMSLHGPSSFFYLSSKSEDNPSPKTNAVESLNEALDIEQHLLMGWIDTMAAKAEVPSVDNVVWYYLLSMHWTWVQPLFGFVHRRPFLRDIHRPPGPGSLFSPFLLYALCAHVTRYSDLQLLGDGTSTDNPFLRQARLLVYREVDRGSSLSAIQGLLLLSAKECAIGRIGQSWVYTGIAVRMLQDLGIHLDGRDGENRTKLPEEELVVRRHSFWSAFLWDKVMSMYLGRTPMLQLSRYSPSLHFEDPEADDELWAPIGNSTDDFPLFAPVRTLANTTFVSCCGLAIIINDVLLYDAGEADAPQLDAIRQKLTVWRDSLPSDLKLNAADGILITPPSHIISLNCLYHMVSILLDRRYSTGEPTSSSVTSAFEICVLAKLSQTHFRDRQSILSHCYCIYTASTIFLYKLRYRANQRETSDEDTIMMNSLQWCIERLVGAALTNAALIRPLAVLREHAATLQNRYPIHPTFPTPVQQSILTATAETEIKQPSVAFTESNLRSGPDFSMFAPNGNGNGSVNGAVNPNTIPGVEGSNGTINPELFANDFWNWPGGGEMATGGGDPSWEELSRTLNIGQ